MPGFPHIIQIPHNTKGHRYAIGDPHGSSKGFCAVLEKLQPNDDLLCVGDLLDRLDGSLDVFRALQQTHKKVYVTRGNHEEMLLSTIEAITHYNENNFTVKDANNLLTHMKCGGEWLFTEKKAQIISIFNTCQSKIKALMRFSKQQSETNRTITVVAIENTKLEYARKMLANNKDALIDFNTLLEIKAYIETLPYIILAGDFSEKHNAFTMVHADRPINDAELEERLTGKNGKTPMLSEAEINHALWARVASQEHTMPTPTGRNQHSILTVVGHDIIGHLKEKYDRETDFTTVSVVHPIRANTNTIDLDGGACTHDEVFLLADLTEGTVSLVGPEGVHTDSHPSHAAAQKITTHLQSRLEIAKRIDQLKKIEKTLTQHLAMLETNITLPAGSLFSPRSRSLEAAQTRDMQNEIARLLRGDPTEETHWIPVATASTILQEIGEQLHTLRKDHLDTWVLV